jgi:hypothetical protein
MNGHVNGSSNGTGKFPPSAIIPLEPEEPEGASDTPVQVAELAASCARFVQQKFGVPLDGTSDTLSLLDEYVRQAHKEIASRPEAVELLQASIGAYLGEVIRRAFDGSWYAVGSYDAWRLDMRNVFLTFNPIGMAREALLGAGHADGWHPHLEVEEAERAAIDARLASLPGVSDAEYFAPSTRYDVVEMVVEALRARMVEEGHGDVTFGPEDYRSR